MNMHRNLALYQNLQEPATLWLLQQSIAMGMDHTENFW